MFCNSVPSSSSKLGRLGSAATPRRPRCSPYVTVKQPNLPKPLPHTSVVQISKGTGRFAKPLSQEDFDRACNRYVPFNTQRNTLWATKVYSEWLCERNLSPLDRYLDILKRQQPISQIDIMLASFVLETRRKDGNCYPANTLKNILGAIYHVMKEKFGAANVTSFMEKEQRECFYPRLHNAMDYHFRLLRCNGIGVERKQATVISPEQEKKMWQKGVLGVHSPKVLLQIVFFYNGKNFCLRCRQEHETLHFSQMVRNKNPDRYTYYEFGSKNYTGGITDKSNGKSVTIIDTGGPRSHVAILDLYFEKYHKLTSKATVCSICTHCHSYH